MGADVTIYCLENLSDYLQFERLCNDLMIIEGYKSIEPLGNYKDKGRDAIHIDESTDTVTIFAYSVREDWQAKLYEDASKIKKHGHTCQKLIFLTTAKFSAGERDGAIEQIHSQYGWQLELYGVERLRLLLDAPNSNVKELHPQIFPPVFFQLQKQSEEHDKKKNLLLLADNEDTVFTQWLARKLVSSNYLVWFENFENLTGEIYPDNIEKALEAEAFCVLAIFTQKSLVNPELMRLRSVALRLSEEQDNDFLLPLLVEDINLQQLDSKTRNLKTVSFVDNWARGLSNLIETLDKNDCPKLNPDGRMIASESFFEDDSIKYEPEDVLSNCLLVEEFPQHILVFQFSSKVPWGLQKSWQREWSFRSVNPTKFLSFHHPPENIQRSHNPMLIDQFDWKTNDKINGIISTNLVSELLRKSMYVLCEYKGLAYSEYDRLYYFPDGLLKKNILKFARVDGKPSRVNVAGKRKLFRPANKSVHYKYHLSPEFRIRQDFIAGFVILLQVRTYFTTTNGDSFDKKRHPALRKHLTKDWWNKEWRDRTMAIAQFLNDGNQITIGDGDERIVISSELFTFKAPYGLQSTG